MKDTHYVTMTNHKERTEGIGAWTPEAKHTLKLHFPDKVVQVEFLGYDKLALVGYLPATISEGGLLTKLPSEKDPTGMSILTKGVLWYEIEYGTLSKEEVEIQEVFDKLSDPDWNGDSTVEFDKLFAARKEEVPLVFHPSGKPFRTSRNTKGEM